MNKLNILNGIKKYFPYWYQITIEDSPSFAEDGSMHWLMQHDFILALPVSKDELDFSEDIKIPRIYNNSRDTDSINAFKRKWPLKYKKKLLIFAYPEVYNNKTIIKNFYKFGEVFEKDFEFENFCTWFLSLQDSVNFIKPVEYKKFIFKREIIQNY